MTAIATARLEARIPADLHAQLKRAAEVQGRSLTEFVVSAVREASRAVLEDAEVLRLSRADQQAFAEALLSPPTVAPALVRAMARHRQLVEDI